MDVKPITPEQVVEMNPTAWLSADDEGRPIAAFIDGSYSYGGTLYEGRTLGLEEKRGLEQALAAKYGIALP